MADPEDNTDPDPEENDSGNVATSPPPQTSDTGNIPNFSPDVPNNQSGGDLGAIDADPSNPEGPGATATESNKSGDQRQYEGYSDALINTYKRQAARMQYHSQQQEIEIEKIAQAQRQFQAMRNNPKGPQQAGLIPTAQPMNPTPQGQSMLRQQSGQPGESPQAEKNRHIMNSVGLLVSTALAFGLYGSARNNRARNAITQGLANVYNDFSQGYVEEGKQKMVDFQKLTEKIGKENNERIKAYSGILKNKKMDLSEQMQMMHMHAAIYKDKEMADAAQARDLGAIIKNLGAKVKAQERWNKDTLKTVNPKGEQEYRQYILEQTKGKVDVEQSPEARQWAMEKYPPSEFLQKKIESDAEARARGTAKGKAAAKKEAEKEQNDDPFELGIKAKGQ